MRELSLGAVGSHEAQVTPMFRQWRAAKEQLPDAILLFRMGDFYEMFGEDAEKAARALDLVLTARDCGGGRRIPMCGIPFHSVDRYLGRLLEAGYKAGICEQTSDPRFSKGLVDREITRVLSPGTALEDYLLDGKASNYLLGLTRDPVHAERWGLAWVDVSTGEFRARELAGPISALVEEIGRLGPAECVLTESLAASLNLGERWSGSRPPAVSTIPDPYAFESADELVRRHFGVSSLRGFGLEEHPMAVEAASVVLRYLGGTRLDLAGHIRAITLYHPEDLLVVDSSTQRNLELVRPIRGDGTAGTLLSVLDLTRTAPGARLLRRWILEPLRSPQAIDERLDAVEHLVTSPLLRRDLQQALERVKDLERLTAKATTGTAGPRDLGAIRATLQALPELRALLAADAPALIAGLHAAVEELPDLCGLLERALLDELPANTRDGGMIRPGFDPQLDEDRELTSGGKDWIVRLEAQEREATGIPSLKVGYNSVFGYYLEITNAHRDKAPEHYVRKQTLRNAERYVTQALKEMEERILSAEERMLGREQQLFGELRAAVAAEASRLLATARALAALDVLACLAEAAQAYRYARPVVNAGAALRIHDGRHPVVERLAAAGRFVPNDVNLDGEDARLAIVTGPNMAGKSTYLRQVALIVLLAQMGSFVPAREAEIGVVDRIFTRVGAHDDLASGQSTFMVEMHETANILHNATRHSLVVLDEIGRGTSTFDGLSIAWAVTEHLHGAIGAKTLFATHYHQLNALEETLAGVRNFRVLVREEGEDMVFLHRIVEGGTDRSYGIQVGRLAGLPAPVVERAKQILWGLEGNELRTSVPPPPRESETARVVVFSSPDQLSLFGEERSDPRVEYLAQVESLEVDDMTPLQALNYLHELRKRLRQLGGSGAP